jgi:hypothetical protein
MAENTPEAQRQQAPEAPQFAIRQLESECPPPKFNCKELVKIN